MSLRDNVDYVKQELNTEEKFLENFVKVERFYKRNKTLIITIFVVLIIASISLFIKKNIDESNKRDSNIAFNKILENPNDKEALDTLKNTNSKLYNIALFFQDKDNATNIDVKFLKELAIYKKAVQNKNINTLTDISLENDFLLKEFAIFDKALLLAQKNEYKKAKETLSLISDKSNIRDLKNLLNHHLATK